ncbi:MAG: putative essential recombination function protein [Prokaryotic dsDNA virus sp.]|nr:MAG: putative essential recombination function protein [Prokaryotic dsDNA virus sp.]|tara:strand:- start:28170 stop:28919 length:750 start_codon:yes stop_codon:yes gene_type:complete
MTNELAKKEDNAVVEHQEQDATMAMLSMIERAARDESVDIDKMERLWEMREKMLEQDRKEKFNAAMRLAQASIPQVVRDAENSHTKSKYARLETVSKAIMPVITENGFSVSFGTFQSNLDGHYGVTCTVSHTDGYSKDYKSDIPADMAGPSGKANKSATHGFGSTISYGRRYLLCLIFNVTMVDEDDDGNAAGGNFITEEQAETLDKLIEKHGKNKEKLLAYFKVNSLLQLNHQQFEKAMAQFPKENEE